MQPYTDGAAATRVPSTVPPDLAVFAAAAETHCAEKPQPCAVCRTLAAVLRGELQLRDAEPWRARARGLDPVRMVTRTLYRFARDVHTDEHAGTSADRSRAFRRWGAELVAAADELARLEAAP